MPIDPATSVQRPRPNGGVVTLQHRTARERISVIYYSGLEIVEASIGDDVICEATNVPDDMPAIHAALRFMLGEVGATLSFERMR